MANKPINVSIKGDYTDKDIKRAIADLQRLEAQGAALQAGMSKSAAAMQRNGEALAGMGKKLSMGLTLPIVGIGVAAGKMAMDFDSAMTKIVSLVGISSDEVAGMRQSVLQLSSVTGKSAKELADALFVVTSAGLRGEAAIKALDASAKAGAAGLGETADIARSVAGAMNAYGPAVLGAARATDIIVATARAGNFETSQFAAALGRVLPFAKQAGASLEEVGGAVALLTRTNGDAAQSVTQISALMRAFVVPTEEAKKALGAAGLSASDMRDRISKDGLAAALTFLDTKLGGNREQLGKLLGSSEAAGAAFQILDADSQTLADTFGVVTDSAGMTEDAFATTAQTAGFKTQQAFVSLQNSLIGVGDIILPLVAGLAEKVAMVANAFTALPAPVKNMTVVFGALLAAIGPVMFIAGKLMTAWVSASVAMSGAMLRLRTSFSTAWASMSASVNSAVIQIKVAMIAAQTQMGALGAGAKAAGLIAVGAFRSIGIAAKGLLLSLGPVGIGLVAVTTIYSLMAGQADDTKANVESLTDALRDQGDQGRETAAKLMAEDLYNKHGETLDKLGLDYADAVTAVTGGTDSLEAFRAQLLKTEGATTSSYGTEKLTKDAQLLINEMVRLGDTYQTASTKAAGVQAATDAVAGSADGAAGAIDGLGADALGAAGDLGTLQTETKKLSDLFLGFDKDVAAIRAKDAFRGFLRDIQDELDKNNRALLGNGKAAQENRETVLDALEKAKADAIAYGEANNLTLAQVETRFQKNAATVKETLVDKGFKKKDLEKFFGSEFVNVAGVSVQGDMATTIGTMADRLGPVALREFKGVGLDLGNGIAIGVAASSPKIDIETRRAITNAETAARNAAESKSPSKVFERIGNDLMAGLEKGVKDKSDKVAEKAKAAIEKAIAAVKDSLAAFTDYKDSISGAVVGLLNLGEAYDTYTARQEAVTTTLAELLKYQAEVQGETTDEQKAKLLELQGAYQSAQSAAANGAQSIVDEFLEQGKKIQVFNDNMQRLLKAGLSRTAFDAIMSESGDRGANIAAALAEGNIQENARRVNSVYTSVQRMGDQTGAMAAESFMGAGVKLAITMLDGLIKEFLPSGKKRNALLDAIRELNKSIKFDTKYIDIVTRRFDEGSPAPSFHVPAGAPNPFDTPELRQIGQDLIGLDLSGIGGISMFAKGGIVTAPTLGMVGEAGPEAIIPLNRANGKIGGTTINLTVNAGMGTQGAEVGRQIVDALKAYERRNGSVYVSA
jgi:TP901 family phage tail tape measure protein